MPGRTLHLAGILGREAIAAQDVLLVRDWLEMVWVDANSRVTYEMIEN